MVKFSIVEAERNFAKLVNAARRGPVVIEAEGRPTAVVLSYEEFAEIEALDDAYWAERAEEVDSKGDYLSIEDSEAAIKGLLGGRD